MASLACVVLGAGGQAAHTIQGVAVGAVDAAFKSARVLLCVQLLAGAIVSAVFCGAELEVNRIARGLCLS